MLVSHIPDYGPAYIRSNDAFFPKNRQLNALPDNILGNKLLSTSTAFLLSSALTSTSSSSDSSLPWVDRTSSSDRETTWLYTLSGSAQKDFSLWVTVNGIKASHYVDVQNNLLKVEEVSETQSVDALLADITRLLGVTKSTLAGIFGVTRPTIYSWVQGENVRIQHKNRQAIELVHARAHAWLRFSEFPPALALTSKKIEGRTLAEWIVDPAVSQDDLNPVMQTIATIVNRTNAARQRHPEIVVDNFGEDLLDR